MEYKQLAKAVGVLALILSTLALSAFGGISVKLIQQGHNSATSSPATLTCTLASTVTNGDVIFLGVGFTGTTSSISTTPTDSIGNTFVAITSTSDGSTAVSSGATYSTTTAGGASDTITISFTSATNAECESEEYSGISSSTVVGSARNSANPSSGSSYPVALGSAYTPLAGDLVIAYSVAEPCGGTSTITYEAPFTSTNANSGITEQSEGNCKATGVKFKLSQASEYAVWSSGTTTAQFNPWSFSGGNTITVNTGGWIDLLAEFPANHYTTTITTTTTSTSTSITTTVNESFAAFGIVIIFVLTGLAIMAFSKRRRR